MNLLSVRKIFLLLAAFVCLSSFNARAQTAKPPVIIIPGLVGSELFNEKTGERVWFKAARSSRDDLRLPIESVDLTLNRDNLAPRGILRRLKIGVKSIDSPYENLIGALAADGYSEGDWEQTTGEAANKFYVFAYDWRRDNVENARILIGKIERLKRAINRDELRFNVVAHSMGGLIARYAAMYGAADLPVLKRAPDWAGAKHFKRIFLVGTPNGGSMRALQTLAAGVSPFNLTVNLPFVQNFTRFDFFTIPSIYQLLPSGENLRAFDENLQPLDVDVYDARTWDKYGWNAANDKNFAQHFSGAERQNARAYFVAALERARRFHEALDAGSSNAPVSIYAVGADCRNTLDAVVIRRDGANGWKTVFKPSAFRGADGKTVSAEKLRSLLFAPGDGIVAKRSLNDAPIEKEFYECEKHNDLVANRVIQTNIFRLLAK